MDLKIAIAIIWILIIILYFCNIASLRKNKELKMTDKTRAALIKKWFEKGQLSIQRKNKSGCCCIIDDADNVISVCGAHVNWLEDKIKELNHENVCQKK